MAGRRTSYQRFDELMSDKNVSRASRVEQGRPSHIPISRKRCSSSLDRISGVYYLDNVQQSGTRGVSRPIDHRKRNRSVDSVRRSQMRAHSNIYGHSETPGYRTPMLENHTRTPMSGMSTASYKFSQVQTPSNFPTKGYRSLFEPIFSGVLVKDNRPISDPSWLKDKGQEVLRKLRANEMTCALLPPGGAPLKPITIRLFLDLTKALLSEFHSDKKYLEKTLSPSTYIEELPNMARTIGYPGVMTKSWLRSVNAGHTYPYMLAFLSFLVDMVEVKNKIKDCMGFETLYGTDENGGLYSLRHQLYFRLWSVFHVARNPDEDFKVVEDEYIEELKKCYKCSDEELESLKEELGSKEEKEKELLARNEKFHEKERNMIAELTSIKNRSEKLKQMEIELTDQIKFTKADIERENKSLKHIEISTETLQSEINALEEQLAEQTMTLKDRDEILKDIDYLNECTNTNNALLNDVSKISFEKDIELATEQRRALTASMAVNKLLMEVGLAAGKDLTCYSIKERELLKTDTLDIFYNTIEEFKVLKSEAESRLQKARQRKDSEFSHKLKLQNDIETHAELLKKSQIKVDELEIYTKKKKTAINELKKRLEDVDSKLKNVHEIKNNGMKNYDEVKKEYDHWKNQVSQWIHLIERMNKDTDDLNERCKKAAEIIIKKYIDWANDIIPDVPQEIV